MRVVPRLLILLALTGICHAQMYEGRQLVNAQLLPDAGAIVPGRPVTIGLRLQTEPGWHTYWQYPGDAGIPTRIEWTLPPGFKAGPIQWPLPVRTTEPGDIVTYGYPESVLLPVEIQTPPDLKPGQTVEFRARASWLVCRELCVPGSANLTLTLPIAASSHPANEDLFRQTRALLPSAGSPPFTAEWDSKTTDIIGGTNFGPPPFANESARESQTLILTLKGLDPTTSIDFFPIPGDVQIGHVGIAAPLIRIPVLDPKANPDSIDGIVVLKKGDSREIWQLFAKPATSLPASSFSIQPSAFSLLYWLFLGFIGGLILNVMPCVLPVIALKIFGFIHQAGESPRRILALGFTFVAGIFAWFLFLATLIVSFKLAGRQLNWAFQFQHPAFVAVMAVILLLFSLNLLGVFEIVLPAQVQTRIQNASGAEGYAGTFWHGVFATLMATPCTAPFLGPALGFALAQPAPTVFAMFGSIAAGMSAPYAVLAVRPGWLRYLPKPGIWMVRVKQALGVLLLGTVLWLGSVLFEQFARRPEPFQPRLDHALAQNKIVFVDFTADWCVNCKVNERLVLDSQPVRDAFRQRGVILLKADWTSGEKDITDLLRKFGRAGVPCYVVYPPGGRPVVLPEVITKDIVLHAIDAAAG